MVFLPMRNFVKYVLEIVSLSYTNISDIIAFHYKIRKITFAKITTDLICKGFNYWDLVKLMVVHIRFLKFEFCTWQPLLPCSLCAFSRKFCQILNLNNCNLSVNFSVKENGVP